MISYCGRSLTGSGRHSPEYGSHGVPGWWKNGPNDLLDSLLSDRRRMLAKAFLFLGIVSAAWFGYYTAIPPPVPQLGDQWWGQGEPRVVDESVRPFTIHVPDEVTRFCVVLPLFFTSTFIY